MGKGWNFRVDQGDVTVAEGSAPDVATAHREAMHYAIMYAQDGEPTAAHLWKQGERAPKRPTAKPADPAPPLPTGGE